MKNFSSWAFRLKQLLADVDVKIPLGHAYELLAAGMKHNSYASLVQLESEALGQARLVIFDVASLRDRARTLGVDLDRVRYLSDFLDILDEPDAMPSTAGGVIYQRFGKASGPICSHSLMWSAGRILEHCEHESLKPIAAMLYEFNEKSYWKTSADGVPRRVVLKSVDDARVVTAFSRWLEPVGEHLCSDSVWSWSFDANVRLAGYTDGYEVPVKGVIRINKLGRMLLGSAQITQLIQVDEPQMFDDHMDQGEVYGGYD